MDSIAIGLAIAAVVSRRRPSMRSSPASSCNADPLLSMEVDGAVVAKPP